MRSSIARDLKAKTMRLIWDLSFVRRFINSCTHPAKIEYSRLKEIDPEDPSLTSFSS
jgi:hypothetical protein